MKTNKFIIGVAAGVLAFTATSCEDNFEKYNTNHYEMTQEQSTHDDVLSRAYFSQLQRSVIFFRDGTYLDSDYQIMYNLQSEVWCGFMAGLPFSNGVNTSSFSTDKDSWTRSLFVNKYTYAMNAYVQLKAIAEEQGRTSIKALADILKIISMYQVVDTYGPVPYSDSGSSVTPAYDDVQSIYHSFFTDLDDAIDVLTALYTADPSTLLMEDDDYVYGGDVSKWIKLANSLRLRLAMRIVYAEPTLAQQEAEKSIAHSIGVMTEAGDIAKLSSSLVDHHPLYEINVNFNDGDTQMNADMDCYLNGYNDPRIEKIMKPASKDGKYHGVRNGVHTSVYTNYRNSAGLVSAPNATNYSIVWMNPAEVWFLRAEGALRGWEMGGDAKTFYENGIAASFEEWGVSGADSYAANSTATPAAFVDNSGDGNDASAPSTITIAYNESDDFETNLERIITQKWIALFPNGPEAWSEYRRTRYPKLLTPVNNDSNGTVDSDLQARRVAYPISEYSTNPKGVAQGVSLLGGPDNAGTKLWWDKKN